MPQGVKVRHWFDAFLDLERFAGLILCKQRLQFVQQRLDLFDGQFVAGDFQRKCLPEKPAGLLAQDGEQGFLGIQFPVAVLKGDQDFTVGSASEVWSSNAGVRNAG